LVHQRKVAVVVDSSSSLPRDLLDRWDIRVVSHELVLGDRTFRDGVDIRPDEFYRLLQNGSGTPTTSSPGPAGFLEAFRSAGGAAGSTVCITLASDFSATYSSACLAARTASQEMPGSVIRVIDSRTAAGAEGLIALEAARAADAGADLEGVLSVVHDLIPRVNLLAFLDTLDYLRRSGRVPRVAALAGSLLGIRPLTELRLGEARMLERPRSRGRAMERLVAVMGGRVGERPVHVIVMHAQASNDADDLSRRVQDRFDCREVFVSEFTPVMGAHLGPGLLGLAFYSDP
jgi:DegV family protein with EDD domain